MSKILFSADELKILGFDNTHVEGGFYYYEYKFDKDTALSPVLITTDGDRDTTTEQFAVYLADHTTKAVFKDKYLDLTEINQLKKIFGHE